MNFEVELIDDRRFSEWLDLFTQDAVYWAPAIHDQDSPLTHVSLMFDDRLMMQTRVTRLMHPQLHCQQPLSRTVHVLGRPRVALADDGSARSRVSFLMLEDRPGAPKRVFGGIAEHDFVLVEGAVRIARKKVTLTDCDQTFGALTIPF